MPDRVFVFGTLKEGFPNAATNRGRRWPGDYQTCDRLPLYLVGERHSPWLLDRPGHGARVRGQVFEVDASTLAAMDLLERVGEPDGYRRRCIEVEPIDRPGERVSVFVYLKPGMPDPPDGASTGPLNEYTLAHAARYRPRP